MKTHIKEIEQFDLALSKIIERQLDSVCYYDSTLHEEPCYDCTNYHSVTFGLTMQIENEDYYIVWNDKYVQFDIKYGFGSIGQEINIDGVAKYDLSQDSNWHPLIGQKIVEAKSIWNWQENLITLKRTYYPKDICLKFEKGQTVFISCTSIENETFNASADEISIFFDSEVAKKYGVGIDD